MDIIRKPTHYEITDYTLGKYPEVEKLFYIWDEIYHKKDEYYYYEEEEKILYLPAGIPELTLSQAFGIPVTYDRECNPKRPATFNMTVEPRDISQKEALRFLLGKQEYNYTKDQTQLVLSLPGGGGKTYCMVAAMSFFHTKAIIIVHSEDIRNQWLERIPSYTNLTRSSIMVLSSTTELLQLQKGKAKLGKTACYICTHRLLGSYIKRYGFHAVNELFIKLGIGIKIIDEVHKEFHSTLMIDYATNVWKTFYLTATFKRSDAKENAIYQRAFASIYKLKRNDEEIGRDRNVTYIAHMIKSGISAVEVMDMTVQKKFNVQKYFAYEMEYEKLFDKVGFWLDWYYNKKGMTGNAFILSAKKSSCDICNKTAMRLFPDKKCAVHYTGNKVEDLSKYDIISATDRMLGTGIDLNELNLIINLVPISSAGNIDQIIHRLMRGKNNQDAFYIECIDESVPHTIKMYERRNRVIKRIVKKAVIFSDSKK